MDQTTQMPDKQYIFGSLLIIANRMDTLLERELRQFGVTSKQWFLSVIIDSLFTEPPTMKEVAREMGSSHQNVKQVALKLQEKNLLTLVKDKKDRRVTRIRMTDESHEFWAKTQPKGELFTEALFEGVKKEDLQIARKVMQKIMDNLELMEKGKDEEADKE